MDMLFTALTFLLVLLLTYIIWNTYMANRVNIPGPTPWPLIGNLLTMIGIKHISNTFMKLKKKYGNIAYLKLGGHFVIVYGYRNIKKVLVDNADKTKFRPTGGRAIDRAFPDGRGVAFTNGQEWTDLRRFIMGAFKDFGVGKGSIEEIIQEEVGHLVDLITKKKQQPIDVGTIFRNATSNVISCILFGSRFDYNDPDFLAILQDVEYVFKNSAFFNPGAAFPFLDSLNPYSKIKKIVNCRTRTQRYIQSRIAEQRRTFNSKNIRNFLDDFLAQEEKLNNITGNKLAVSITDVFFADSVCLTLQWCVFYMMKYPDVQEKCQDEIAKVIGCRRPIVKDKDKLPYVMATLHEIRRMATIAPINIPRMAMEDVYIGGRAIPKGSTIVCSLLSVHYDPEMWDQPEEFKPERFLGNDGQFVNQEAFCALSMGPRDCLGKHLAEQELFLFFTTFLQLFHLQKANISDSLPTWNDVQTGATNQPQQFYTCFIPRSY